MGAIKGDDRTDPSVSVCGDERVGGEGPCDEIDEELGEGVLETGPLETKSSGVVADVHEVEKTDPPLIVPINSIHYIL